MAGWYNNYPVDMQARAMAMQQKYLSDMMSQQREFADRYQRSVMKEIHDQEMLYMGEQRRCGMLNKAREQQLNFQVGQTGIAPTQKGITDYMVSALNAREVVLVDEFEVDKGRHVCPNGKAIHLLPKRVACVITNRGQVNVEFMLCPYCFELIVNKSSLNVVNF